jgi:hypothetical protein
MVVLIFLFLNFVASPSSPRFETENAALRQQLLVVQRKVRGREAW